MRNASTHCEIGWTCAPEDDEGNVPVAYDFRITATAYPGEPAVMYDRDGSGYPGSPATIDDIQVSLDTVHDCNGSHVALLEPNRTAIEERFRKLLDTGGELSKAVEYALLEDAGARAEGARDAHWQQQLDEYRERGIA